LKEFDSQKFDEFVFGKMRETALPSVTAAIIQDGVVKHLRAFGHRDVGSALPATPNTLYGVGSVTKSFVALSIAKLVEEGRLEFHDPVTKFLPSTRKAFEGVEIHHLLSHTSGIPGLGYAEVLIYSAIGKYHDSMPVSSLADMNAFLSDVDDWVESKPGEKLFYLNEGYFLLGEVVTRVSGRSFERYMAEEIFRPLKMKRTFLSKAEIEADGDRSTPYLIRDGKATASVIPYGCGAAGGVVSNVVDLSNYVQMFIDRGEFEGRRIVSRESIEKMEKPYARWPIERYGGDSYGYGLQVIPDFHGHKVVGHGGSVEVYTSDFRYAPDMGAGVVLLSNGTGYGMGTLGMNAMALLMGEDPDELLAVRTETLLKRLEGTYGGYKGTVLAQVKVNGSVLVLSGDDIGENIVLVPGKQDSDGATFFTLNGGSKMDVPFRFNKYGVELIFERYRYRRTGPLPRDAPSAL
jgi:CubicO group peptidase (beta-lactamase class C family)